MDIEQILAMASQPQLRRNRRNKIIELLRTKIEKNKKIIEQLEQAEQQLNGGGDNANSSTTLRISGEKNRYNIPRGLPSSNLISWTERLRQFWQPTISCWRKKIT